MKQREQTVRIELTGKFNGVDLAFSASTFHGSGLYRAFIKIKQPHKENGKIVEKDKQKTIYLEPRALLDLRKAIDALPRRPNGQKMRPQIKLTNGYRLGLYKAHGWSDTSFPGTAFSCVQILRKS